MGVERPLYHGTCFVGNQCPKVLKNVNIETFCNSVPDVVLQQVGDGPIYEESIQKCNIFKTLYSKCHVVFNWFWTFKRNSIELILLNPTKFKQIRKFENFRMKKKRLKKVCKLKLPLYIHI